MATQPNIAERGMAVGLKPSTRSPPRALIDRLGLRDPAVRLLHGATKTTARTAATAGRTFAAAQRLSRPARQPKARRSDLFDLTPSDEQQMLRDSVRDFAMERIRPLAPEADEACAVPEALLAQANELGLTMVGVPEELGGAVDGALGRDHGAVERGAAPGATWGSRWPAWRRPRCRPRSACGATPSSRRPTCPSSSVTTCPPRRWR